MNIILHLPLKNDSILGRESKGGKKCCYTTNESIIYPLHCSLLELNCGNFFPFFHGVPIGQIWLKKVPKICMDFYA